MQLFAYTIDSDPRLIPASITRKWMDRWPKRHPYHCLPLAAANGYGWVLESPVAFQATWDGTPSKSALVVTPKEHDHTRCAYSLFGGGVLTFDPECLLRTDAPYQLFVTGPLNAPKDGLSPLSAIVETSWLPFTFTMNWMFTRPNVTVSFEKGEPFCQFFPIVPECIEQIEPELCDLEDSPTLWRQYHEWNLSRDMSNGLSIVSNELVVQHEHHYNHNYHRGETPNGEALAAKPRICYLVKSFSRRSGEG